MEHIVPFYASGQQGFYAVQLPLFDVTIKVTQSTGVEVWKLK
jgi:hypothetical protein